MVSGTSREHRGRCGERNATWALRGRATQVITTPAACSAFGESERNARIHLTGREQGAAGAAHTGAAGVEQRRGRPAECVQQYLSGGGRSGVVVVVQADQRAVVGSGRGVPVRRLVALHRQAGLRVSRSTGDGPPPCGSRRAGGYLQSVR